MSRKQHKRRKKRECPNTSSSFKDINMNGYEEDKGKDPVNSFLEKLKRSVPQKKAYKVLYRDNPKLLYFTFAETRELAATKAFYYFRNSGYPEFIGKYDEYFEGRGYRVQELDKFSAEGKVPIPNLMQHLGVTFPCSNCGEHDFSYNDYKKGECYIIEGDGDLNEFTKGFILCHKCYKKYIE